VQVCFFWITKTGELLDGNSKIQQQQKTFIGESMLKNLNPGLAAGKEKLSYEFCFPKIAEKN